MAFSTRKPPLAGNVNRRSQPSAAGLTGRDNRSPTPQSSTGTVDRSFLARRNTMREGSLHTSRNSISSPLSARSAAKRPTETNNDAELENAVILEDVRSRLAKSESAAEAAAEEYTKQIKALQIRLHESSSEQVKMEETMHAREEVIENLEMQIKDLTRSKRDQENIYEAERIAAQQEKEELLDREEELNTIIQRLKDTLSQRERSPDRDGQNSIDAASIDESAGSAPANHGGPGSNNNLVLQKDKLIESLRLELAEAQIRLAEADHLGGTKLQQLEHQLLETRMTNARLMEDNESFQLLLSSAALNGDFPRGDYLTSAFSDTDAEVDSNVVKKVQGSPRNSVSGLGSNLAEELEEADKEESERYRKLEAELKALKDQNKAMSLYINNIIERILQHKDSEAILDKTAPSEKPLPSPPKEEEESTNSFLQRTKSLAMRRSQPKPTNSDNDTMQRSQSTRTAPAGSHKRSQSDASAVYSGNNGYRSEGAITPRATSFFSTGDNYTSRRPRDSSASVDSGVSDINTNTSGEHSLPSSPPPQGVGMGIGGNKLRPLRLVQENVGSGMMSPPLGGRKLSGEHRDEEDEKTKLERRQSKRSSWMGWFNRGKEEEAPSASIMENVVPERKEVE